MENNKQATLLLDLDDTLLLNSTDSFLPAYFQAIEKHLGALSNSHEFMPAFMAASQQMLRNHRIDQTLEEVFYTHFLAVAGFDLAALGPEIDRFYREAYPQLQPLTSPVSGAAKAVAALRARKHTLVAATNPLFPKAATRQRIDWAGLPIAWQDFELVTTFEAPIQGDRYIQCKHPETGENALLLGHPDSFFFWNKILPFYD